MWLCHVPDDLLGTDVAANCHSPLVLRYGPVPGKPRTNNTPCAWNLAELLSLRVHAGGPEPPPLGANSAVATTSTSPSPALAHPRPLVRPCPLAPVPPCRPVALFPSFPPYPRFSFALSPTPWHTSSACIQSCQRDNGRADPIWDTPRHKALQWALCRGRRGPLKLKPHEL